MPVIPTSPPGTMMGNLGARRVFLEEHFAILGPAATPDPFHIGARKPDRATIAIFGPGAPKCSLRNTSHGHLAALRVEFALLNDPAIMVFLLDYRACYLRFIDLAI